MEEHNIKVTEGFIKELLELYNKYVLLGISKVDMIGVIINTLAGLYMTLAIEFNSEEEENEDDTIH